MQLRHAAGVTALLAAVALSTAIDARAQESRTVYARMTFKAEARAMRTAACLQIGERTYPQTAWWDADAGPAGAPERAFKAVIAAMRKKDRPALLRLTDPAQKRDLTKFDSQAGAFFQQFETIRLVEVPRAYEFDDMVVFFARFQSGTESAFVPMAFSAQGEDSFAFLPERGKTATFELVTDWFAPRPALADSRLYCSDTEVARATHRVELARASYRPSALLLTGAPVAAPGPVASVAKPVLARLQQMTAAMKAGDIETFVRFMTVEGGGRLLQWWASAPREERERYRTMFLQHDPFFIFDESPLVVVYIRIGVPDASKPTGVAPGVQLLYFTQNAAGEWVWTNSSHITAADRVFKDNPMGAAAASPQPFSRFLRQ